jgi:glucose-1-phosphate adenylyltransferase
MGIYLFNVASLKAGLDDKSALDFGRDIIPTVIHTHKVHAHIFDGYWEDIGTIRAFYEANIDLVNLEPKFHFYRPGSPIYTRARYLPASKLYDCKIHTSVISEGCLIREAVIDSSIIGIRTRIKERSVIRRSVLMGADYYESEADQEEDVRAGRPEMGIGQNVIIENAIIDKNARIGDWVIIRNDRNVQNEDGDCYFIRDGIVVIPKNGVVPPGKII